MCNEIAIEAKDLIEIEKFIGYSCKVALLPTEDSVYLIVECVLPNRCFEESRLFSVELATIKNKEHKESLLNNFGEYVKDSIKCIIKNFKSSEVAL
jgi:hypothetical protein